MINNYFDNLNKINNISNIIKNKQHIIITGLHRSCTSILFETIKKSELVSGHNNTGYPKDEASWLQSIYPQADEINGIHKFCFSKEYNLNENSDFLLSENKILYEWSKYWDLNKQILVQKSPSHIIHTRFIQKMLPNSYFVLIKRHPVFYYYSLYEWTNTYDLEELIDHWIYAHKKFNEDTKKIKNVIKIKSEEFIKNPIIVINRLNKFLNIDLSINDLTDIKMCESNSKYRNKWILYKNKDYIINKYELLINKYGYSFNDI
jgi:hypothetical protein